MDAREQAALAPFVDRRVRREAAAQGEAFGLERRQRRGDLLGRQPKRRGERGLGHRSQAFEPAAQDLDQRLVARPFLVVGGRRGDRRVEPRAPATALGSAAAARPRSTLAPARIDQRRALRGAASSSSQSAPAGAGLHSSAVRKPSHTRPSCSSSALAASGQASPLTRSIASASRRPSSDACSRRQPAARHHRLGAALLERRVVEIGVGPRGQHLERERRRLREIARRPRGSAPDSMPSSSRSRPSVSIASLEAIAERLADQRMVGDLALAGQVLGAGDLVGEDRADQVLGGHARELRRHLAAAAEARQGERHAAHPAPARGEHRRSRAPPGSARRAPRPSAGSAARRRARSCAPR